MPCSRTVGDVEAVTRKKNAVISKKNATSALKLDTYVAVVPTVKVTTLVLCMEITDGNLPRGSRQIEEIQDQREDDTEGIVDAQADFAVAVVVDTDNTK